MRSEPEVRFSFQCGMSLKSKCWMLRMNDYPHEEPGPVDPSRDERVCNDPPSCGLVAAGSSIGLRTDRARAQGASVPSVEQRTKRDREELPGQGHDDEPRADDASDPALQRDPANREEGAATAELSAAVYGGRYRHAGGGGHRTRGFVRARRKALVPAGLGGVRRPEV